MSCGDPQADHKRLVQLLKHGAHALAEPEAVTAKAGDDFAAEGIESILAGRTQKRQLGSRAGNTFSTATFGVHDRVS